jgi:hypothetical protein
MPQLSGSFLGKTRSQAMVSLQDAPDHELSVVEISGSQKSADPLWDGATVLYWGAADLVAGTGTQTGYFMNRHPNGHVDRGTFQGKITTAAGIVTMEGSWQYSGGTGTFSGITGGGTYRGHITSPTEVQVDWEGMYQLG